MTRQMSACTPIGLVIRELKSHEHKSYTNEYEWSDMRMGFTIAGVRSTEQLNFINKINNENHGGEK